MTDWSVVDEHLIEASCSIRIGGQLKGTGWLFDETGHILTAGHVLGTGKPADEVQVAFLNESPVLARRVRWVYDPGRGADWAVLALDAPSPRKPVSLNL